MAANSITFLIHSSYVREPTVTCVSFHSDVTMSTLMTAIFTIFLMQRNNWGIAVPSGGPDPVGRRPSERRVYRVLGVRRPVMGCTLRQGAQFRTRRVTPATSGWIPMDDMPVAFLYGTVDSLG